MRMLTAKACTGLEPEREVVAYDCFRSGSSGLPRWTAHMIQLNGSLSLKPAE